MVKSTDITQRQRQNPRQKSTDIKEHCPVRDENRMVYSDYQVLPALLGLARKPTSIEGKQEGLPIQDKSVPELPEHLKQKYRKTSCRAAGKPNYIA